MSVALRLLSVSCIANRLLSVSGIASTPEAAVETARQMLPHGPIGGARQEVLMPANLIAPEIRATGRIDRRSS